MIGFLLVAVGWQTRKGLDLGPRLPKHAKCF